MAKKDFNWKPQGRRKRERPPGTWEKQLRDDIYSRNLEDGDRECKINRFWEATECVYRKKNRLKTFSSIQLKLDEMKRVGPVALQ